MVETIFGYFDVIGWKSLFQKNKTVQEMKQIYTSQTARAYYARINTQKIKIEEINEYKPSINTLETIIFSDNIFYYSTDISEESIHSLIEASAYLLANSFGNGFLLRGVINFGDLYIDCGDSRLMEDQYRTIVMGKSIIDAYETINQQNWFGSIVLEPFTQFIGESVINKLIDEKLIKHYNVPFKKKWCGENTKKCYSIDWVSNQLFPYTPNTDYLPFKEALILHTKKYYEKCENRKQKKKIDNTLKFIKSCFQ